MLSRRTVLQLATGAAAARTLAPLPAAAGSDAPASSPTFEGILTYCRPDGSSPWSKVAVEERPDGSLVVKPGGSAAPAPPPVLRGYLTVVDPDGESSSGEVQITVRPDGTYTAVPLRSGRFAWKD